MGRAERAAADPPARRPHGGARRRPGHPDATNMGKPFPQAKHDVARSVANFRFFADHQRDSVGEAYPMDSGHHTYSEFGPAGVVAAICPVELPADDGHLEDRPGDRVGQHLHHQAERGHPGIGDAARPPRRRGRLPARRAQRAERARRAGRLLAHRGRPGRPGDLHRLLGHRQGDHGLGRHPPGPGLARAGRQGRQPGLRRRRPRQRRALGGGGDLPQLRPDLPRRVAAVRAVGHLRRVHGPVRRGRRGPDHRRPVRPVDEVLRAGEPQALRQGARLRRVGRGRRAARSSPAASPRTGPGWCGRRSSPACR